MRLSIVLLAAAATLAAGAANAATISFENPATPNYSYGPYFADGVSYNGLAGVSTVGSPFLAGSTVDGTQAAHLQSTFNNGIGAISFTVENLTPITDYDISFYLANRPGYSANTVKVSADGVSLGSFTAPDTGFTQFFTDFITGANTSVRFVFSGSPTTDGDNDVNIDAIDTPGTLAAGSVPEPATWALMLGGFGFVGAAVRRRGALAVAA